MNRLTLGECAEIALVFWPGTPEPYLGNKAALVADVEFGVAIPTMSAKDRAAILREIEKKMAART